MRKPLMHPYLMLLLAPLIWSTSNVIGKYSVHLLSSLQLTFYRWVLAFLLLSLFGRKYIKADMTILWQRKGWITLWGASAFCVFNLLFYTAFHLGSSIVNVSILNALAPILIIFLGAIFCKQPFRPIQILAAIIAITGVCIQLTNGNLGSLLNLHFQKSDTLILLATLIYAIYSLALLKAPKVHWVSLMWGMSLAALLTAFPFWLSESITHHQLLLKQDISSILQSVSIIFYVAIFIAILSLMFYIQGVIAIGPSRSSLALNLLPLFNVAMGLIFFADERQQISWANGLALIFVLGGIFISEYSAKNRSSKQ